MKYQIMDTVYDVVIEKKHNKNTYIRLKEPNIIYITTGYFTTKRGLEQLLKENTKALNRMHKALVRKQNRMDNFYYLGKNYDIIIVPTISQIEIIENRIFTPSEEALNKWLLVEMKRYALKRTSYYHTIMKEDIPEFKVKFRKMKTRWGVCSKKTMAITLNSELIKYDPACLDYVIVHELSHFIHFNHSKDFWNLVETYCPNYKEIRKQLKG